MADQVFRAPSPLERGFNCVFGALVRLGIGLPHNFLLEVRGRKSGKLYTAPIDLLTMGERSYLVCPRGRSQWVRNAEAAGEVSLVKGFSRRRFKIRALSDSEKPPMLKAYLDRFKTTVQRYFPPPAGSPVEAFAQFAARYPVFELIPVE